MVPDFIEREVTMLAMNHVRLCPNDRLWLRLWLLAVRASIEACADIAIAIAAAKAINVDAA